MTLDEYKAMRVADVQTELERRCNAAVSDYTLRKGMRRAIQILQKGDVRSARPDRGRGSGGEGPDQRAHLDPSRRRRLSAAVVVLNCAWTKCPWQSTARQAGTCPERTSYTES
jgi:hypothetical protein